MALRDLDNHDDDIIMFGRDRAAENRGSTRSAYDLKDIYTYLSDLPDHVLKHIPIVDIGQKLNEGATYIDLTKPEAGEFTGMSNMVAGPDEAYVSKSDVDLQLWNLLIGVTNYYRLGWFEPMKKAA